MGKSTDLDKLNHYYIPNNFTTEGTLMGGSLKIRNVVEGGIMAFLVGYPIWLIPMNMTVKIVLLLSLCAPLAVLGIIGINSGPVSEFLSDYIKLKKAKRIFVYKEKQSNSEGGKGNE